MPSAGRGQVQIYVGIEHEKKLREIKKLLLEQMDPNVRNFVQISPSKIIGSQLRKIIDDTLDNIKTQKPKLRSMKNSEWDNTKGIEQLFKPVKNSVSEVTNIEPIDGKNQRF